jgi:hypothetical protein
MDLGCLGSCVSIPGIHHRRCVEMKMAIDSKMLAALEHVFERPRYVPKGLFCMMRGFSIVSDRKQMEKTG